MRAQTARRFLNRPGSHVAMATASATSLVGTLSDVHTLVPRLHAGTSADPFTSVSKGVLGEVMADALVHRGVLGGSGWTPLATAGANHGIDGLYVRVGRDGRVLGVMVAESKTYTSTLNTSQGGQMGPAWLERWLHETADLYSVGPLERGGLAPAHALDVPLGDGSAKVWQDGGVWKTDGDTVKVGRACARISRTLEAAAERLIRYRARIFRYTTSGDQHVLTVRDVDPSTGVKGSKVLIVSGRFEDLSPFQQKLLRQAFRAYFEALGQSDANIEGLVERACHDPGFAQNFQVKARWWMLGLTAANLARSAFAGVFAGAVELGLQVFGGQRIEWQRVVGVAALTFGATMAGLVGGAHVTSLVQGRVVQRLFARTALGVLRQGRVAAVLGSSSAAGVAALLYAYGGALFGLHSWGQAHRLAAIGVTGAAAGGVVAPAAFLAAQSFGTASTGTAIGSLFGAAKTSATLAWIGGGVGGGVAAGSAMLTGGAFLVVLAAGAAVRQTFSVLDERERLALVEGRILLATRRLA